MIDLTGVKHHPAMEETVDALCKQTQKTDRGFFQAEMAYFFCKMAAAMRAKIDTHITGEIPVNMYAVALATSGYGKGRSVYIVENELMKGFKRRFLDSTFAKLSEINLWSIANKRAAANSTDQQEEYDKAEKEWRSAGPYLYDFDSGTSPAVKQLRSKLLYSNCGAFNFQMDEIGANLEGNTEVFHVFLELYDQGMVKEKLIKNGPDNKRVESIDGKTPSNMLAFGTPSKLLDGGATEKQFMSLLDMGYARRCLFGFGQESDDAHHTKTPEEIYDNLAAQNKSPILTKWRRHFHTLADEAMHGWAMTVPRDVGIKLVEYQSACKAAADELHENLSILKAEIAHRYFKALKLAGAYAFIDQSNEIEMDHLLAAILVVEESGQCLKELLDREPNHVRLARYMSSVEAVEPGFSHAELMQELPYYKAGQRDRTEMMSLAQQWGYKNNIIIRKQFVDGLEFFTGESLKETNLDELIISYSDHFAYHYEPELAPFDQLHLLTQAEDLHWANHHFKNEHRSDESVIPGFNTIVIDLDGQVSRETVHELMSQYKFMTYTTKRHTEDENRFRLILPMNYHLKLDADDYKKFMNAFMEWLPFDSDDAANQRSKKWQTHPGEYHYNHEGQLLDVLPFIPKTSRNEQHQASMKELASLDSLERWFAERIANGNRNNQMIKFALALVDSGMDLITVSQKVHAFNEKLQDGLSKNEIDNTIMVTVAKRLQKT